MKDQKPKRPRSSDKGTSVSRKERVKSFNYDGFGDVITDGRDDHISVMKKKAYSKDPELRLDCIECVKDWLARAYAPVGCVFNIWEYDILDILGNSDAFSVIVNFQPWMINEEKEYFESAFKQMDWLARSSPAMVPMSKGGKLEITGDYFSWRKGLHVYARWDDYGNQALMHEKFLISEMIESDDGAMEALYGSFNMPQSGSKKNLESILHFKQNSQDIILDLGLNFELILESKYTYRWEDLHEITVPHNAKKYGS